MKGIGVKIWPLPLSLLHLYMQRHAVPEAVPTSRCFAKAGTGQRVEELGQYETYSSTGPLHDQSPNALPA
jgi:hypothetical protein